MYLTAFFYAHEIYTSDNDHSSHPHLTLQDRITCNISTVLENYILRTIQLRNRYILVIA